MTKSRSFAPVDPEAAAPAPPPFPLLPFALTAYADHLSRDYVSYWEHAQAPPAWSEATPSLDMFNGMNQALYALVWAPLEAAMVRAQDRAPPRP
jgi:hypothetical protein